MAPARQLFPRSRLGVVGKAGGLLNAQFHWEFVGNSRRTRCRGATAAERWVEQQRPAESGPLRVLLPYSFSRRTPGAPSPPRPGLPAAPPAPRPGRGSATLPAKVPGWLAVDGPPGAPG